MAQAVRPHLDRNSRLLQMLVDDARHAPGRDPLAAIIEKDRRLALAGKLPAPALLLAIIAQRLHGDLTDRNDPLFGALADHPNNAELKIDVGPIEADQLTDTDAGRIKNFQHGSIPHIEAGLELNRAQEMKRIIDRQKSRQRLFLPRRMKQQKRIFLDLVRRDQIAKEFL